MKTAPEWSVLADPMMAAAKLAARVTPGTAVRAMEPMARHTTLRVGGPADLYVEPADEASLAQVLAFCREEKARLFVVGRGSNLLVQDGGFRGVILSLKSPVFERVEWKDGRLVCGAGARLKTVAVTARRHGLAGLEFLEGIPGSVGGALRMNAGAMGSATWDRVEQMRSMDFHGNAVIRKPADLEIGYRHCEGLRGQIALECVFTGHPDSPEAIGQRMLEYSRKRWASQPAAPSAGCAFKNPAQGSAGKIIDELGLKGLRVGGALVSREHGNFIINEGGASARDVLELIDLLRERVREARALELQPEIEILEP